MCVCKRLILVCLRDFHVCVSVYYISEFLKVNELNLEQLILRRAQNIVNKCEHTQRLITFELHRRVIIPDYKEGKSFQLKKFISVSRINLNIVYIRIRSM